jgi:hypothetical protein
MCASMTRRIEITVSDETWRRLDGARGHEPRASFVKRALERALGPEAKDTPVPGVERPAAPPRASEITIESSVLAAAASAPSASLGFTPEEDKAHEGALRRDIARQAPSLLAGRQAALNKLRDKK